MKGYGPLIDNYMTLLTTAVNFRVKYEFMPGTLKTEKIDIEKES